MTQIVFEIGPVNMSGFIDVFEKISRDITDFQMSLMKKTVVTHTVNIIDRHYLYEEPLPDAPLYEVMAALDNRSKYPHIINIGQSIVKTRLDLFKDGGKILCMVTTNSKTISDEISSYTKTWPNDSSYFTDNHYYNSNYTVPPSMRFGILHTDSSLFHKGIELRYLNNIDSYNLESYVANIYDRAYAFALAELGNSADIKDIESLAAFYSIKLRDITRDILMGET